MNLDCQPPLTTYEVRKTISAGIEQEICALHKIALLRHILYLIYPLMAVVGAVIVLAACNRGLGWNLASLAYTFGVLVVALAINAMFLLIHEGVHGVLFPQQWLNYWVSVIVGIGGFVSFSAYRVLHLRHHEYLGDKNDPDDYHNYTSHPRLVWLLHYNRLLWATLLYLIFVPGLAWRYGNQRDRFHIAIEYLLLGCTYTVVFYYSNPK